MTETTVLTVPEAAAHLGRSERTIWRQIRSGELASERVGRRVWVVVPEPAASDLGNVAGHRTGEAVAAYRTSDDWTVGDFPYTAEVVERHRRAKLERRRRAFAEMDRLARLSRPDPDGLTGVDYIRAYRDHPRALEGGDAADRALDELARERRRHR
jgi:excisionase family DNA binding protein